MTKTLLIFACSLVFAFCVLEAKAQSYRVENTGIFIPQKKKVLLLAKGQSSNKIILFQTHLRVNTDGSPRSYHPSDLYADQNLALNNICNGVSVKKTGSTENLCLKKGHFAEAVEAFRSFQNSNYLKQPDGYKITWANVFAARKVNNREIPCIFQSGDYKGYFGSLTRQKNGLTNDKGECEINDQLNAEKIPTLVLAGGRNILTAFGAEVGDLLVAYNPRTQIYVAAIIGDTGPPDNLGEGSIALGLKLRGRSEIPKNYAELKRLSIENTQVLVAIIQGSNTYSVSKPFTVINIEDRVMMWQRQFGFSTPESFVAMMRSFSKQL